VTIQYVQQLGRYPALPRSGSPSAARVHPFPRGTDLGGNLVVTTDQDRDQHAWRGDRLEAFYFQNASTRSYVSGRLSSSGQSFDAPLRTAEMQRLQAMAISHRRKAPLHLRHQD
jgi:hypothetical protein